MKQATPAASRRIPAFLLALVPVLSSGIAVLLLATCTIDGPGMVYSKSTPDERFAQSRAKADPLWSGSQPGATNSFVFITDTHVFHKNISRLAKLNAALAGDSFLLVGGDLTQNGASEDISAYRDWCSTLPIPVYSAIGNHDLYFDGWDHIGPVLGQSSFTLAIGKDLRVIILDSGNATLGKAQFRWLESVLATAREGCIVVVSHYPFFSTGFSEINYTDSEESAALIRLFDRHKVRLVLSGHTHKKYMRTIGSTNYVVGEAARVEDSGQKAIRVKINGTSVTTEDFDLP